MRKKRLLSFLLLAGLIIFSGVYYVNHSEDFQLLRSISGQAIIILTFLEVLMILSLGLQMKLLTDHYKLGLTFVQCFGLARLTSMANLMFGFAAGASVKAVYLKRFHDLKYGSFVAAAGIAGIIKLMVAGLIATVLLLTLGITAGFLLLLAGTVLVATALFFGVAHRIPPRFFTFWSAISDLVSEWRLIRHDRRMILHLLCLSVLLFVIYSLEVYLAFEAFGITSSLSVSGVITAFDNFASAVKLIPGNVGVKEAIFGIVSTLYGIGVNEGVHAAVLHRVIRAVVSLVVGSGFAYKLVSTDHKQIPLARPKASGIQS
jgi:uncharacterized membrane protein YbhN (UPF0104 family)